MMKKGSLSSKFGDCGVQLGSRKKNGTTQELECEDKGEQQKNRKEKGVPLIFQKEKLKSL